MSRRLKIFTWNIHDSYLRTLTRIGHDFYFPVKPDKPYHYAGKPVGARRAHELTIPEIKRRSFDVIILHTHHEVNEEQFEVLSKHQRQTPKVLVFHTPPKWWRGPEWAEKLFSKEIVNMNAIVHVTEFNREHWGKLLHRRIGPHLPVRVIYHGIEVPPDRWTGERKRVITATNYIKERPDSGFRHWQNVVEDVPHDLYGAGTEQYGGLGAISHARLLRQFPKYPVYFNPANRSSLPMAMLEAMAAGVPPVARRATDIPNILTNGKDGYFSDRPNVLTKRIRELISNPAMAQEIGAASRETILRRFSMERFIQEWNTLLRELTD